METVNGRALLTAVILLVLAAVALMVPGGNAWAASEAAGTEAAQALPADDTWTGSAAIWQFRHEDQDKSLCKPVKGETLLLDEENKTTGKASIRFRYKSAEALKIRTDIPQPTPRQIYNVLYLPNPPVDATGGTRISSAERSGDGSASISRTWPVSSAPATRNWRRASGPSATRSSST